MKTYRHLNTAVGALRSGNVSTGERNTAIGQGLEAAAMPPATWLSELSALYSNTSGSDNTASGTGALKRNTSGDENTAVGLTRLGNTVRQLQHGSGYSALRNNTAGLENTASGLTRSLITAPAALISPWALSPAAAITTANGVICIGTSGANVGDSLLYWRHS